MIQHIHTNPKFRPWREDALRHGFASALSLPLLAEGVPYAALVILAGEADAFNQTEVTLLEELAEGLSYGIRALKLKRERKKEKEEQRLLIAVIEQGSEGVLTCDADGTIQYPDPTQIHQVIMNLCTNAADAMREIGGELDIQLEEVSFIPEEGAGIRSPGQGR